MIAQSIRAVQVATKRSDRRSSFGVLCRKMTLPREIEADEDWTERFITCIQEKPAIYDKRMKEHSDRNIITRLWTEVCETMVPLWHGMTANEKSVKGKEIQQRWRNLRTCFKRELNKQQKGTSGKAANKRRKYIYFDQLLFLLHSIQDRETVSEASPPQLLGEDTANDNDSTEETTSYQPQINPVKKHKRKTTSCEDSLLSILREKKNEEIDEDKTFLLSLVPSFKRMTDDEKYQAKMEFLSVIRRITQPKPVSSTIPNVFQGSHHQHFLQDTGNKYPQNSTVQTMLSQANVRNEATPSPCCSIASSDRRRDGWVSSEATSPMSEFLDLS